MIVGPNLPGVGGDRVVLRSHVTPPFNVGQYPSPLAAFRIYTNAGVPTKDSSLNKQELFTVTGVEPGTLVRMATLDSYDGTVWGAANDAGTDTGVSDTYQKVGSTIANPATGTPVHATVTIGKAYDSSFAPRVWLPTIGSLETIDFRSSHLQASADDFRYNLASSSAVLPGGLRSGDSYSFTAVVPDAKSLTAKTATAGQPIVNSAAASDFQPTATSWAGGASTPMGQVLGLAAHLRTQGTYTNGEDGYEEYRAGHSVMRLKQFTDPKEEPAGDDEQYAATMALLANQVGVPARIVLGAAVPANGEVHGSDVHAWVELRVQDGTWQPLPTGKFMDTTRKPLSHKQKDPQLQPGITVPPPVPVRPPATVGDPVTDSSNRHARDKSGWSFHLPGFVIKVLKYLGGPLLLISAIFGLILLTKAQRRRRRRTRGAPTHRLALAYREVVDQARDLGKRVYAGQTRREQASSIGDGSVMTFARSADAHVFGAGELTDEAVEAYWKDADALRHELTAGLNRRARLKAAVNLASFRPLTKPEAST